MFLSVGGAANSAQRQFVDALKQRIRSAGFVPKTVGDGFWDNSSPLRGAQRLFERCHGAVVLGHERYYFPQGTANRGEGEREDEVLTETCFPTAWNHMEGAMAFDRDLPMLILRHRDLSEDGVFGRGVAGHPHDISGDTDEILREDFSGYFDSWAEQVRNFRPATSPPEPAPGEASDPSKKSMIELLGELKPGQAWKAATFAGGALAGAFALGAKLFGE